MPYPEVKTESYSNIGGVNQKASQYVTGLNELLQCVNLDLTKPGSLTKRPGSAPYAQIGPTFGFTVITGLSMLPTGASYMPGITLYTSQITYGYTIASIPTSPVLGIYQYSKLNGESYIIFAGAGPAHPIVTRYRVSVGGVTTTLLNINPSVAYSYNGSSAVVALGLDKLVYDDGFAIGQTLTPVGFNYFPGLSLVTVALTPSATFTLSPQDQSALYNFTTFVDYLFLANGSVFEKFNGHTTTYYSLPSNLNGNAPSASGRSDGASGTGAFISGRYGYAYGYVNERGYLGPAANIIYPSVFNGTSLAGLPEAGYVFVPAGQTYTSMTVFGLSSPIIPIYYNAPSGQPSLTILNPYGVSQIVIYRTDVDQANFFELARIPIGSTTFTDTGVLSLGVNQAPVNLWFTLAPRYLEIYNNQLFMAGFSSLLSTVYFSNIGEPEAVGVTASFEVRTNDGDRITGLKTYYSSLAILKRFSMHQLTGTDPSNFQLNEVSDQYGALSNRAICVYQDKLLFLDRNGIAEFNGANIGIISTRMEPFFRRMNIAAAIDNAQMIHVEPRNEVWCAFPIDGATMNNFMVVYDYVVNGFYTIEGPQFSYLNMMNGNLLYQTAFNGGYSGLISYFGSSQLGYFPNDNGVGFSCVAQPRFMDGGFGYSVTKQFRRLFLDLDPSGVSSAVQINFRKDEGASIVYGTTMPVGPFQHRIDYGIPGKTISAEIGFYNASLALRINGWTYHSRFQRDR